MQYISRYQSPLGEILYSIPYGQTMAYGEIAKKLAAKWGLERMPAQAVGGAVARNEISVIVPCHRVVGTNIRLKYRQKILKAQN